MEVHALDIGRVLCKDSLETVVSFAVVIVVDAAELSLELRSDILQLEMLVHVDVAPVRHRDRFCCLCENQLWVLVLKK